MSDGELDGDDWVYRLIEATQDAVVTIDGHSRIVLFNAAAERMFGYTAEEVRGADVHILMPEPYHSEHAAYVERYEATGEAHAIGRIRVVTARRRNGEEFPIELSVTEVAATEGRRYGAFIRDISEKVALQRDLVQAERLAAIGTTAAKFAHEVANPLSGMYTQAQLLQRRLDREAASDERIIAGVQTLVRDIERLNGLLLEFRSLSRRQEYRLGPTDLARVCGELVETFSAELAERGCAVRIELPEGLPPVYGDAPKLKQVLLNLCKNAMEAMPDGGSIVVGAHLEGPSVVMTVADDGVGIPEGLDVFAPFATTKPAGTGLGLPIVREIMRAHNGSVGYRSVAGQGTVFSVILPRAED